MDPPCNPHHPTFRTDTRSRAHFTPSLPHISSPYIYVLCNCLLSVSCTTWRWPLSRAETYHHTYTCDDIRGSPDDEHMCSKHVEAWNKLIVKQKFCTSNWLITEMHGQQNIKKELFLSTIVTRTRRHTELTTKLKYLMGKLCFARKHPVQLFVQFFTQLNCTV